MLQTLSPRLVFLGLVLLAAVSMIFAVVILSGFMELEACPLCMTQRVFVVGWGVIALLAFVHNPGSIAESIYASPYVTMAVLSGAGAVRLVWLQRLPVAQVPACGPPLEYLVETLPFTEVISTVLMGDGNCAETVWTFMGLSIPEQTLILFCVASLISLWQTFRRYPLES